MLFAGCSSDSSSQNDSQTSSQSGISSPSQSTSSSAQSESSSASEQPSSASQSSQESEPNPSSVASCTLPAALAPVENRSMLVVRVNFNDMTFRNSAATWNTKIFGTEMHELNHYYDAISRGRFGFEPVNETDGTNDGIITITLDKDHPEYNIDDSQDYYYTFQPDLITALRQTDAYIDFSQFDKDGNGAITPDELIIVFLMAGNEYAFSGMGVGSGVWAHSSCISLIAPPTLDGVSLMGCSDDESKEGNYAVFGERHYNPCFSSIRNQCIAYDRDASIGIIAHELGHAVFDLPDLYDTTGTSAGIGYFGLMAAGMWGDADLSDTYYGNTPVQMCAWSKLHNSWLLPEIVSETTGTALTLNDTDAPDYNIAVLPVGDEQCFLIENRGTVGYDTGLNVISTTGDVYRGGLAVWHIDQSIIDTQYETNSVNADASHKGVDLEEANAAGLDDDRDFPGDARNLFWADNQSEFTEATDPSSRRYDGSDSGVRITGIGEAAPIMQAVAVNPNKASVQ